MTAKLKKSPILKCRDLSKSYGEQIILRDIALDIPRGQTIGLVGPKNSGKTTLLKLFAGLLTPTTGKITLDNQSLEAINKEILAYSPTHLYLDPTMSVREALQFFAEFYTSFSLEKAMRLVRDHELDLNLQISKLGLSSQNKLQLILVLSRTAQLYLLDEPLSTADAATRFDFFSALLSNLPDDASLILATKSAPLAEKFCREIIHIQHGKITKGKHAN